MAVKYGNEDLSSSAGFVTHVAAPTFGGPAFALPIVTFSPGSNAVYVQQTNPLGRVTAFEQYHLDLDMRPVEGAHPVSVGDREIFALIDPMGELLIGSKVETAPKVANWLAEIPSPLTRIAFSEFCDSSDMAGHAAQEAVSEKAALYGYDAAISWFANSVICQRVHRAFSTDAAENDEFVDNLDMLLSQVQFSIIDRSIWIFLPETLLSRLPFLDGNAAAHMHSIRNFAGLLHHKLEIRAHPSNRSNRQHSKDQARDRALLFLRQLSKIGRQEERVSFLLEKVIEDYEPARLVLDSYQDRSRFASKAVSDIRDRIGDKNLPRIEREIIVARYIRRLFTDSYPMRRGELLLTLASYLSNYTMARGAIEAILLRSSAQDVNAYRSMILKKLQMGESRSTKGGQ